MLLILIALMLLVMRLLNDFNKDKGQNTTAKTFHAIILGSLVFQYATSINHLGWLFRHFDKAREYYFVRVGVFPREIHFMIFILNIVLGITVVILAFMMASRQIKARRLFLCFFPLLAVTELFNFYRGWMADSEGTGFDLRIFGLGFIPIGGLAIAILIIYHSNFMKSFFNFKPSINEFDKEDVLDSTIE